MNYLIRPMEIDDINSIIAGENDIFGISLGFDMLYNDLVLNPLAQYLVLEIDGSVEGYIGLWIDEVSEIINFYVSKDFQGLGFGRMLLDFAVRVCGDSGVKVLSLEVRKSNKKAIKLYKSFGFIDTHIRDRYYEDGEDAIIMVKVFEVKK